MKVFINNNETETTAATLLALAQEMSLPEKGVALAMNNEIVPRTQWETTMLKDGAQILIVKAFCGG